LSDPPFFIAEAQFRRNQDKNSSGLASNLKIGAWAHTGKFEDQRYATDGMPLADPASNGIPLQRRGNLGVYGVIDLQLYRPAGGGPDSGISVFSRGSASPSDRNLVDQYIDGGIVFAGLIPGRPNDRFGASAIYARFSDSVRGFDLDQITFTGIPRSVRDYEANIEFSYVAEIIPGLTLQPDFQLIFHPSGQSGADAKVFGVRSNWRW
jgi:porin